MKKFTKKTEGGFIPIVIAIIIVAALAIGGGYYAYHKKAPAPEAAATSTADVQTNTEVAATSSASASASASAEIGASGSGTLRALFAAGKDLTCTFSGTDAQGSNSGTVYISGGMMRGDFTMKASANSPASAGGPTDSHLIKTGDSMYVWSGSQGAKMAVVATGEAKAPVANSNSVDLDKKVDYKCSDWSKDSSKFTVPSTVKFVDISAMMKQSGSVGTPAGMPKYPTVNADIQQHLNVTP